MSDISERIGERVRSIRKARKITLKQLASEMDVHFTYLGALERGEKRWNDEILESVASALGVSLPLLVDFNIPIETASQISSLLGSLAPLSTDQIEAVAALLKSLNK